jgi:hypothetical protein
MIATTEEIIVRLAMIIGKIVHKISRMDFHIMYKTNFVEFFLFAYNHKDLEMRRACCYNLPCFNALYKDY